MPNAPRRGPRGDEREAWMWGSSMLPLIAALRGRFSSGCAAKFNARTLCGRSIHANRLPAVDIGAEGLVHTSEIATNGQPVDLTCADVAN